MVNFFFFSFLLTSYLYIFPFFRIFVTKFLFNYFFIPLSLDAHNFMIEMKGISAMVDNKILFSIVIMLNLTISKSNILVADMECCKGIIYMYTAMHIGEFVGLVNYIVRSLKWGDDGEKYLNKNTDTHCWIMNR